MIKFIFMYETLFFFIMLFKLFNFNTVNCDVQFSSKSYSSLPNIGITNFNPETDKAKVLRETKNRAGFYQWTHVVSGKTYVGSAINLSQQLKNYYNKAYINRYKNSRILNAIFCHGYGAFNLTIQPPAISLRGGAEYIDITNLSIEESKKLYLKKSNFILIL